MISQKLAIGSGKVAKAIDTSGAKEFGKWTIGEKESPEFLDSLFKDNADHVVKTTKNGIKQLWGKEENGTQELVYAMKKTPGGAIFESHHRNWISGPTQETIMTTTYKKDGDQYIATALDRTSYDTADGKVKVERMHADTNNPEAKGTYISYEV